VYVSLVIFALSLFGYPASCSATVAVLISL